MALVTATNKGQSFIVSLGMKLVFIAGLIALTWYASRQWIFHPEFKQHLSHSVGSAVWPVVLLVVVAAVLVRVFTKHVKSPVLALVAGVVISPWLYAQVKMMFGTSLPVIGMLVGYAVCIYGLLAANPVPKKLSGRVNQWIAKRQQAAAANAAAQTTSTAQPQTQVSAQAPVPPHPYGPRPVDGDGAVSLRPSAPQQRRRPTTGASA